ncbi:hypothetical protein [Streptomyces misionensis]|uniref:hypothetical protein n=1 Tax=Streptomyces misionensis TaxID=67331 RepID=UPI00396BCCA9
MSSFFAGHSHGPTPHLVTGCPLCDATVAARNQAIEHLSEAVRLLAGLTPETDRPTIRLNIAPIDLTADDTLRCHSIDIPAKLGEALADAIDSMNAHASSDRSFDDTIRAAFQQAETVIDIDHASLDRRKAELMAWMEAQSGEVITSGVWSAAAVAQNDTELYAQVTDVFDAMDWRAITKQVLDEPLTDAMSVTRAMDDMFGQIADPYADEDDA